MTDLTPTQHRKNDHLRICTTENVNSSMTAGFENVHIPHCALPEINFDDISLQCKFLGQTLSYPLLISSMTGGSDEGEAINQKLAQFAQKYNLAMGVGSQRVLLENRSADCFALRRVAPKAVLLANIGAVQLNYGVSYSDCTWLVEKLQAQGLILHLNALQEAIQPEGNRNFEGLLKKISELKKQMPSTPLILKETGCGLDYKSAVRALEAGVDILDVAGLGGTHWGFIEGLRSSEQKTLGTTFRNWGNPTAALLADLRKKLPHSTYLIASGGIRTGLEAAKAFYLGADLVGMALPFLISAQSKFDQSLDRTLETFAKELKVALFCSGSKNIEELKKYGQ